MFTEIIEPRFLETDALGHINNNTYGVWFEAARNKYFQIFNPSLDVKKWNIVMAHGSYDFLAEVFFGTEVIVKTALAKIGGSSMELIHSVYQNGKLCTTGTAIMIYYNFETKKSMEIPSDIRTKLEEHMYEFPWPRKLENIK